MKKPPARLVLNLGLLSRSPFVVNLQRGKKQEQKMAGLRLFVVFPFLPQFLSGSRRKVSQQAVWRRRDLKSLG